MKRRLIKLGNDSYSITLPKTWVIKNNLSPKKDLEVLDNGESLLISAEIKQSPKGIYDIHVSENESEESIITKITALYREGAKEIRIISKNGNTEILSKATKYAHHLFGVKMEEESGNIILHDADEKIRISEFMQKCARNIFLMASHLNVSPKDSLWRHRLFEIYERTHFMSEYVFRLVNIQPHLKTKEAIRIFSNAYTLQCVTEIIKRICEHEYELSKKGEQSQYYDAINIFKKAYEVCKKKIPLSDFILARDNFESDIKQKEIMPHIAEDISMLAYLSGKLVKHYMIEEFVEQEALCRDIVKF